MQKYTASITEKIIMCYSRCMCVFSQDCRISHMDGYRVDHNNVSCELRDVVYIYTCKTT